MQNKLCVLGRCDRLRVERQRLILKGLPLSGGRGWPAELISGSFIQGLAPFHLPLDFSCDKYSGTIRKIYV